MDVREKLEVIAHLGDHISYKEDVGICYDSALAKVIEDAYMTLKNGVTVQEWIPVTERLPERHGGVYVCLLKFPEAKQAFPHCLTWHAYGDNGYVNGPHFSDEGLDGLKVTHWMPLPEPPKEEK